MKNEELLTTLEETAEKLSVRIDYDDLKKGEVDTKGGLFKLKGKKRILIHKGLSPIEKIGLLTDLLASLDIESVHIPTEVREIIEEKKRLRE
jgi:hypothetical protein